MTKSIATLIAIAISASAVRAQAPAQGTLLEDLRIAQAEAGRGSVLLRARPEAGGLSGFYFFINGRIVEIEIRNKKIEKNTDKDKIPVAKDVIPLIEKMNKGKTKLPDGRLIEIAMESLKDSSIKNLEYKVVDGKLMMQIGDLLIDAETGKIVSQ